MDDEKLSVVLELTPTGLQRAYVLYEEGDVDSLERGNLLLARLAPQLTLLDNALRMG
jgi:hypothetical protein